MSQSDTRPRFVSLLDAAQAAWLDRFLKAAHTPDGTRKLLPFDLYCWAIPRSEWDGYPNLALVTWPS